MKADESQPVVTGLHKNGSCQLHAALSPPPLPPTSPPPTSPSPPTSPPPL